MQRVAAQQRNSIDVDKEDDDVNKIWQGYAWESSKIRSWEQIKEDPVTGRLKLFEKAEQIARKKRRDDGLSGVRRGVIRFCALIVDMSEALRTNDYKPSRAELVIDAVTSFVTEFFDQNPISQLAVILTRDADAAKLCAFTNNTRKCTDVLRKALRLGPNGTASLQNAINIARRLLATVPPYGMREILVCFGSLSTCDPGDIHATIDTLAEEKVRCVAVGMAAELHVLRVLTKKTDGTYVIAVDENHYRDALSAVVVPPPTTTRQVSASLIRMGFPILRRLQDPAPYCNNPFVRGRLGYKCPRCTAWLSEMPCECTLCGLTLVSSPHLARSYHHLFPVPKYVPLDSFQPSQAVHSKSIINTDSNEHHITALRENEFIRCTGCAVLLKKSDTLRVICPACLRTFCIDCDTFVHDSLHHCPGCSLEQLRAN